MLSLLLLFQTFGFIILIIGFWDLIWKGIALWHAAKAKQNVWFVVLFIVSSGGILPIIYLLFFKSKKK